MWTNYNKETRKQIVNANAIAIKYNTGTTKMVTDKDSMKHYVKYDCSSLIYQFRIL